jgi:hypothetical protein
MGGADGDSMTLVRSIEAQGTQWGEPKAAVLITDCGEETSKCK